MKSKKIEVISHAPEPIKPKDYFIESIKEIKPLFSEEDEIPLLDKIIDFLIEREKVIIIGKEKTQEKWIENLENFTARFSDKGDIE